MNVKWVKDWKELEPSLFTKTSHVVKDVVKDTGSKVLAFSPLIFLAWDYYNSGSFVHSVITCVRDFMWPAAVVVAKSLNASPY